MTFTDPSGVEWVTPAEAIERLAPRLRRPTLDSWVHRGTVRSRRVNRSVWLVWGDVARAEAAAHRSRWQRGRRAARRGAGQDR